MVLRLQTSPAPEPKLRSTVIIIAVLGVTFQMRYWILFFNFSFKEFLFQYSQAQLISGFLLGEISFPCFNINVIFPFVKRNLENYLHCLSSETV